MRGPKCPYPAEEKPRPEGTRPGPKPLAEITPPARLNHLPPKAADSSAGGYRLSPPARLAIADGRQRCGRYLAKKRCKVLRDPLTSEINACGPGAGSGWGCPARRLREHSRDGDAITHRSTLL